MPTPAIAFEQVSYGYDGEPVVEDVSFSVAEGELFVLLGPNGSGKTTLIKLALGLLRPLSGTVRLFGVEASSFRAWDSVGYVPQRATGFESQFPATVAEVVAQGEYTGASPLAFFRPSLSPAVAEALRTVGMWAARNERIGSLSRGQQQRVLIARSLVRRRTLLVLDEPTAGIDQAGQQSFYGLLQELHEARGVTVMLISHDVGVVLRMATRVACINRSLVFHGSPADLTEEELSRLYGVPVGLWTHRH
ncbi:MAG: metal ABC transporter ATP-binding protein [Chloroflexi bacterium]|nr:metal ABC transporter ATP-binding protein [Chloroflexota bacterium]